MLSETTSNSFLSKLKLPPVIIASVPARSAAQQKEQAKIQIQHGLSPLMARLLCARGFTAGTELTEFLKPDLERELTRLGRPKGLTEAVRILAASIARREPIAICHDYDVDGCSSAAQLILFLRALGVEAHSLSPDRVEDGFGLNCKLITRAAQLGAKTIVALDFGSGSVKEIKLAAQLGMKTIVIDHHEIVSEAKAKADALVNPTQTDCPYHTQQLCTAGLVWLLIRELSKNYKKVPEVKELKNKTQALAALGTVADVVPLRGINRALVATCLAASASLPALKALMQLSHSPNIPSASDIAFKLAPHINALSRMESRKTLGRSAGETLVQWLCTSDLKYANNFAEVLSDNNQRRKEVERRVKNIALSKIARRKLGYGVVVHDENFHEGVSGIVAARLVDLLHRPVCVGAKAADGRLKFSARSVPGINLIKILKPFKNYLHKFGGHAGAAGFSIKLGCENKFLAAFNKACRNAFGKDGIKKSVKGDFDLTLEEYTLYGKQFIKELELLEPCGYKNPKARFRVHGAKIVVCDRHQAGHLRVVLSQGCSFVNAWIYHQEFVAGSLQQGTEVDLVVCPAILMRYPHNPAGDQLSLEILAVSPKKERPGRK